MWLRPLNVKKVPVNIYELLTPRGLAFQIGVIISSNSLCSLLCGPLGYLLTPEREFLVITKALIEEIKRNEFEKDKGI
jgi:hypothetical protein